MKEKLYSVKYDAEDFRDISEPVFIGTLDDIKRYANLKSKVFSYQEGQNPVKIEHKNFCKICSTVREISIDLPIFDEDDGFMIPYDEEDYYRRAYEIATGKSFDLLLQTYSYIGEYATDFLREKIKLIEAEQD